MGIGARGERRTLPGPVHAWERWEPAWHAVFFGVHGLAALAALADPSTSWGGRAVVLAGAVALASWYWYWALRRRLWGAPAREVVSYLLGAGAIWMLLIATHDAFFVVAFSAYGQVFAFLPSLRSALPAAGGLTALLATMQFVKLDDPTLAPFVIGLSASAAGVLLAVWVDAIIRESRDRHAIIQALEATRSDLAAAERLAGTLAERERLAAEIHDTLAQGFTSIVTLLEAADAELPEDQPIVRRHVSRALRTARDNLSEARRLVWALQPPALAGASLTDALGRLVEHTGEETGTEARLSLSGEPQALAAQAEVALLRAAQEGLANVRKHAQAREVVVTLSYVGDRVVLDVRDDGCGFDPAAQVPQVAGSNTGLGLPGLKARFNGLGGSVDVESAPGEGTALVVQVPLGHGEAQVGTLGDDRVGNTAGGGAG